MTLETLAPKGKSHLTIAEMLAHQVRSSLMIREMLVRKDMLLELRRQTLGMPGHMGKRLLKILVQREQKAKLQLIRLAMRVRRGRLLHQILVMHEQVVRRRLIRLVQLAPVVALSLTMPEMHALRALRPRVMSVMLGRKDKSPVHRVELQGQRVAIGYHQHEMPGHMATERREERMCFIQRFATW